MNGDFYLCGACRSYFPVHHPEAPSWYFWHQTCTLPEYVEWDMRLAMFEDRVAVHIARKNEIPDEFECTLHPLELLAYGGTVTQDVALELTVALEASAAPVPAPVQTLTDAKKDELLGAYTWCTVCEVYTLLKHRDSLAFRVKHGSCRGWRRQNEVLGGLTIVWGTPLDVVQYGDVAPDGYATSLSPMEELAFGTQSTQQDEAP